MTGESGGEPGAVLCRPFSGGQSHTGKSPSVAPSIELCVFTSFVIEAGAIFLLQHLLQFWIPRGSPLTRMQCDTPLDFVLSLKAGPARDSPVTGESCSVTPAL